MILSLIAAIGKNNELGKGNDLIFKIPEDQKHFRERTLGHSVIMGRKTFESLPGGSLPKRRNIVITRDINYKSGSIEVVHSIEEALEKVRGEKKAYIIGGAEIYKLAMPYANELDITHVEAEAKDADAFFPEINQKEWKVTHAEPHEGFTFKIYKRK